MADPTRPGEVSTDLGLVALAELEHQRAVALVCHRHGIDPPLAEVDRRTHALAALAYGAALAERALRPRWLFAVEALDAGATVEAVATACGLDVEEFTAGLRGWAAGQLRYELIDPERHAQVLVLIERERGAES